MNAKQRRQFVRLFKPEIARRRTVGRLTGQGTSLPYVQPRSFPAMSAALQEFHNARYIACPAPHSLQDIVDDQEECFALRP